MKRVWGEGGRGWMSGEVDPEAADISGQTWKGG